MTKTQSLAMLAALIAQHYGPKRVSAFTAGDVACKLQSLANAIVDNETWQCNGFKGDQEDKILAKLSRENPTEANAYASRLWEEGSAAYERRKSLHRRRMVGILNHAELPVRDFEYSGLYCGIRFTADGRDFGIATS